MLTSIAMMVLATPLQVVTLPVDLGGAYLKRPEVLLPALKAGLTAGGAEQIGTGALGQLLDPKRAATLVSCSKPVATCLEGLPAAYPSASEAGLVLVYARITREPTDSRSVTVKAYSFPDGHELGTYFEGGLEGEDALARVLGEAGTGIARGLRAEPAGPSPFVFATRTDPVIRKVGWGFVALGGAAGIFSLASTIRRYVILHSGLASDQNLVGQEIIDIHRAAEEQRVTAVVSAVVCGASLITASVLLYFGFRHTPVQFEVLPGNGGVRLGLSGTF